MKKKKFIKIIFVVSTLIVLCFTLFIPSFALIGESHIDLSEGQFYNGALDSIVFTDYEGYQYIFGGDGLYYNDYDDNFDYFEPINQVLLGNNGVGLYDVVSSFNPINVNRQRISFDSYSSAEHYSVDLRFNSFNKNEFGSMVIAPKWTGNGLSYYTTRMNVSFDFTINYTRTLTDEINQTITSSNYSRTFNVSYLRVGESANGISLIGGNQVVYVQDILNPDSNSVSVDFGFNHNGSNDFGYLYAKIIEEITSSDGVEDFSDDYVISNLSVKLDCPYEDYILDTLFIDYDIAIGSAPLNSVNSTFTTQYSKVDVNIFQWVTDAVQGFLDITIFGNITFGHLILTVIAIPVLIGILKMIAGG